MLTYNDPYCSCPHCGNKTFKDVSIYTIRTIKDEFGDIMARPFIEEEKFQCTRCGKIFDIKEIKDHKTKQG